MGGDSPTGKTPFANGRPAGTRLPIRVAVHSHTSLEQGALEALVATLPGLALVAVEAAPPPAVLLWDPGPESPGEVPTHAGATAILLLTEKVDHLPQEADVAGLFSREETPASLGVAVRQVARGQEYLSPSLALALLRKRDAVSVVPAETNLEELTAREREVLALLGEGLGNKEIAARLYLSVRTVEGHLSNAYAKLDVHSRTEAALFAARLL